MDDLWAQSRGGSHAGRGFHYQDAVATELALTGWDGQLPLVRLIPEGLEDVSLQLPEHSLHLQAKSRRAHRGAFKEGELADAWLHLAKRLVADPSAHVGLVLERPLPGAESGLDRTLDEVAPSSLKKTISAAVGGVVDPAHFLDRAHVLVTPASESWAVGVLSTRLGLPPASCVAHYRILRARLADLAAENGVRDAANAAALTVADVARLLADVSEAVDPSALDEAVRGGVVELVDFATPISEPRFFSGVDVVAGHVVAGLPLERDHLVEQLHEGLERHGLAIAVGPSGAGKSALVWLTAFATRHLLQWYRVRRLRDDDVPAVVRLVKGLHPTGARVGFVVDDLGRDDRLGFDRLVEELRDHPEAVLLGACREEDLFVVRSAPTAVQVRPELDPFLAERIWRELTASGQTTWPEWREPFEASRGLLLEYGHLLTEGTRLEGTIREQVDRRVREQRALELELLALIATADAFGADLDVSRVRAVLDVDGIALKVALARLVDEHLIRDQDGLLGGLHELRSRHVMQAVHDVPPPTIAETAKQVINLVEAEGLQPFLTRLLLERAVDDEVAVDAVAERILLRPDAVALSAALHALRLVGFRRMASEWSEILEQEDAAPTNVGLIAHFALHGGDVGFFPESLQRAVARIRQLEHEDLRGPLLAALAETIPSLLEATSNIQATATVLAALGEVGQSVAIDAEKVARTAEGATLEELRTLLESSYAASSALAARIADAMGGSAVLLERLREERPWLRDVNLGMDDDGRTIASAKYAYVAEAHQPRAHDSVVELARYLAALAPTAEVAMCAAVDATGETAGLGGVPLADKAIDRRNLPSQAEIAWNRARGRAALAAVAAATVTEHQLASREVVVRSLSLLRRAGDAWTRGRSPTQALYDEAVALALFSHRMKPVPIAIETVGPLDEGDLPMSDPASYVGTMITNQLFVGLFNGERIAPSIPILVGELDELAEPSRWRLLDKPPLQEVAALRQVLLDVHAVAAEHDHGDRISVTALANAGKNGLVAAARVARRRAGVRMQSVASAVERRLAEAGFSAKVVRREGKPESHRWPSDDFLILVDVASIYEWLRSLETIVETSRPLLEDRVGFYIAPVHTNRIIGGSAVKVISDVFPDDSIFDWPDLPLPLLDQPVSLECGAGLSALVEVSGILSSVRRNEVHDDEAAVAESAMKRANETSRFLSQLAAETGDPLIGEISATFIELARCVEQEAEALDHGAPVERGVAASIVRGLKGEPNDVHGTYVGLITACAEWDADPEHAWARFNEFVEGK